MTASPSRLRLSTLLPQLPGAALIGGDALVEAVECRPEQARPGCLMGVFDEYLQYNRWLQGTESRATIVAARPAALLLAEPWPEAPCPQLIVPDPRRAFAVAARQFYGCPDESLALLGVTGTNGKTTTTHLLAHMLTRLRGPAGSLGTLGASLGGKFLEETEYTTALVHDTCRRLEGMQRRGAWAVAMEVSSHALALDRVAGLRFRAGVFTNLTRDHLDFHGSMEAYVEAKTRLFRELDAGALAILNRDAEFADAMQAASSGRVVTYGLAQPADFQGEVEEASYTRTILRVRHAGAEARLESRLIGRFQAYNLLAAVATATSLGFPLAEVCASAADFPPVLGRMQPFALPNGAHAIVDYAHNPGGLENLLLNCRELQPRRLLLVFGCGGDRDRGKRPLMGALAERFADAVWVTSDNPRTEDPAAIIDDILAGMRPDFSGLHVQADRRTAIEEACAAARPGDLVVVAGKGHEDYQIIGYTKHPFSDHAVLRELGARA